MASNSLAKDQKGNQRQFTLHSEEQGRIFSAFPTYAQWSEIDNSVPIICLIIFFLNWNHFSSI